MVKSKRELALLLLGAFLVLNSSYLASAAAATLFYYGNVVAHLVAGLAGATLAVCLLRPFTRALWRPGRGKQGLALISRWTGLAGMALLAAGILCGVLLMVTGATRPYQWLLHLHIAATAAGLLLMIPVLFVLARTARQTGSWRWWIPAALALGLSAIYPFVVRPPEPGSGVITNEPTPPPDMARESMGGETGPFFPSAIRTSHGGRIPADFFLSSESCGRPGCHVDITRQWSSSAHRFSSFNNQWYRKSIEYMQDTVGVQPSKWCAGCHDVALLLNGMMDRPVRELLSTPEAHAGLSCTACHSIVRVHSTMGQGHYEIEYPPLHRLSSSDNPILRGLHDFLVKIDPEPHRRIFLKPFHRRNAEFCSACHKAHLDVPVNHYRWIRGFNEYDNWQASGVSGQGARSFYYPPQAQVCSDCHMPMVPSDDAGNIDGLVHSHRFPGANTALPVANKDAEQLRVVTEFLKNSQVTLDIFPVSEVGGKQSDAEDVPTGHTGETLPLSSTFAVGEEQAAPVGRLGLAPLPDAAPIVAPIDRARAAVRRGRSARVDVVVRTRGVGHFFPGGTVDAFDVWVEFKATDSNGRVLFWSGGIEDDGRGPVDPGAHAYRALLLDARGNPINKRNVWAARSVLYVRLIPPGAADTVRFLLQFPQDAGDRIDLEARLNYRKFSWWNTHWSYAGVRDPTHIGYETTPDYDDGRWVFTGDTSGVSGALKDVPVLPVTTLAEARASLRVLSADAALPVQELVLDAADRERWNDYGIGLLLQGDLKAAERAFRVVTKLEPDYVDGWVNIGRSRLREGDLAAAKEAIQRALELEPDLPRARFFEALVHKSTGEYEEALLDLRHVTQAYPRDRVALNQIGRILFLMREYNPAVEVLQDVLRIDPEDLQAHYNLMLCYRGLRDAGQAEREQQLYLRFKADEASQALTGEYRRLHPYDNLERQSIHEHVSTFVPGGYLSPMGTGSTLRDPSRGSGVDTTEEMTAAGGTTAAAEEPRARGEF